VGAFLAKIFTMFSNVYSSNSHDTFYGIGIRALLRGFALKSQGIAYIRWSSEFDHLHGTGLKIALFDSGINWRTKAFRHIKLDCRDFTDSGTMADSLGHGTKNVSLLFGNCLTPEDIPLLSDATLLLCKVLGAGTKPVKSAIAWACSWGAKIIILPFGHAGPQRGIGKELAEANQFGVSIFAAAGNRGPDILLYPASSSYTFAVTGADREGRILKECYSGKHFHFIAPGIVSCPLDGSIMRGSSTATILAAGVAALSINSQEVNKNERKHD